MEFVDEAAAAAVRAAQAQKADKFSAAIFRRGAKLELFADGQDSAFDEEQELLGKLGELHDVWSLPRTGKDVSAAIWRPQERVAEVVLQKGKLFSHMGFMRGSKLHLHIEEAVYLVDRANLMLFVEHGRGGKRLLSVHEAQELMVGCGVSMSFYLVYCKLMRAGYIAQRYPSRWMLKPSERASAVWPNWYGSAAAPQQQAAAPAAPPPAAEEGARQKRQRTGDAEALKGGQAADGQPAGKRETGAHMAPLAQLDRRALAEGSSEAATAMLALDVYVSNSQFSRKLPDDPLFRVVVCDGAAPPLVQHMAGADLAAGSVPVRYASVERGDIAFYAVAATELHVNYRSYT